VRGLGAADLRADMSRIKAPTLVMCGENDIFLDSARWLADNIQGAKLA
jgi:pimeloyl-ACP methyl ester carboxylesterase